jgi:hypothetical protein
MAAAVVAAPVAAVTVAVSFDSVAAAAVAAVPAVTVAISVESERNVVVVTAVL